MLKVQTFGLASDDSVWNHGHMTIRHVTEWRVKMFMVQLRDIRVPDFSVHTFSPWLFSLDGLVNFSVPDFSVLNFRVLDVSVLNVWTEKSGPLMSLNRSMNWSLPERIYNSRYSNVVPAMFTS